MGEVKVFVLYHKLMPVFRSEVFEPLQTGCADNGGLDGFLHDNTGENISGKNRCYAELTGNYWVWKNYLPAHPELEYVGFCHYRRNWDLRKNGSVQDAVFFRRQSYSRFLKYFGKHSSLPYVLKKLNGCDILLPGKLSFAPYGLSNLENYRSAGHPDEALSAVRAAIEKVHPESIGDFDGFFAENSGYFCLNYIMRRELFADFMTWLFSILDEVENARGWDYGDSYERSKMPAYMAERLLNVWLKGRIRERSLRIAEKAMVVLVEPDKGFRRQCIVNALFNFYHVLKFHRAADFFGKWFRREVKP